MIVSFSLFALPLDATSYMEWPSDILLQNYELKLSLSYDHPQALFLGDGLLRFEYSIFTVAVGVKGTFPLSFDFEQSEYEFAAAGAIKLGSLYLAASVPFDTLSNFAITQAPKIAFGVIAQSLEKHLHTSKYARLDISYIPDDLLIVGKGTLTFNEEFDPLVARTGLIFYSKSISRYSVVRSTFGFSFIIEDLKSFIENEILSISTDILLGGKVNYLVGYSNSNGEPVVKAGIGFNINKLDLWILSQFYNSFDYKNLKSLKISAILKF